VVTRLDRLARSTRDLLNIIHDVAERGAGFKSLKDAWADTTTPISNSCSAFSGGELAEFERELIRARTGEGRKRAKDRACDSAVHLSFPHSSVRKRSGAVLLGNPAPK
jgi:DNA invertase Pin-like site-specific DNA recombinase